jgi:hypothetical protein
VSNREWKADARVLHWPILPIKFCVEKKLAPVFKRKTRQSASLFRGACPQKHGAMATFEQISGNTAIGTPCQFGRAGIHA